MPEGKSTWSVFIKAETPESVREEIVREEKPEGEKEDRAADRREWRVGLEALGYRRRSSERLLASIYQIHLIASHLGREPGVGEAGVGDREGVPLSSGRCRAWR